MTEILNTLKDFHLAFLPLFVVMDPLGNLPFFLAITAPMEPSRRQKVARVALSTGVVIGLVFLALGRGIFAVLGIEVEDFLIAGGVVLLVLAMRDLVASHPEEPEVADEMVAVVPIGTPMLVGPATISILLVLTGLYDVWMVVLAFLANILMAWVIFSQERWILRVMGKGGLTAFSKVMYLLLVAIAVQLISRGVIDKVNGL